ncbi:Hsp20/alpha crystallin family protein [Dethiosulfatarculus sandiegensis]|uniref:Heat shock protein Hsp20 n=1 Tax=Dethiosulfatarculus sandiegensis TaxID=1429043 RepID=A0A0D2HVZ3_9BACT|nr:Hsp20/alpha crystallin family protein [Dethiosulfatarculus sandiegensis]KIX14538.1 heat shock protein Hsp20 [Dethiosulfatarculus sandiegensis]
MSMIIRFSSGDLISGRMRRMLERIALYDQSDQGSWSPAVDIYETPDQVVIVAELAGVNKDQVQVILDDNVVRLYGRREPTCCSGGARFHRMEIESGTFVRSFRITPRFIPEKVQAQMEDGLLYIFLPKEESK